MDGTLLNTEDIYTEVSNELLARFGKGPMTWDVKIQLQGRPGPEATQIMIDHYELPLTTEEFVKLSVEIQADKWRTSKFLPGALELLEYLHAQKVPIALGTSSNYVNFEKKTAHLLHGFKYFAEHIVTGDDQRIPKGRGKPHPDIWMVCLATLNDTRKAQGLEEILLEECLIFEDGIPGVISGIAAKSHVIWIPDVKALEVLNGKELDIIGTNGEILESLHHFDRKKYNL